MRHGRKRKLTTQDMERALKWYDAPPTFGHHCNEAEQNYIQSMGSDFARVRAFDLNCAI